jgi:hypothetical protein
MQHIDVKKVGMLVAFLLSILMLIPLTFAVGAEQALPSLTLDPQKMSSISDGGNGYFALPTTGGVIKSVTTEDYSGKVLRISRQKYIVTDTNGVLTDYPTVTLSVDLYFHAFPSGDYITSGKTHSADPKTSGNFYTQSLLSWIKNNEAESSAQYQGVRIDSEGNLYSGTNLSSALGVSLTKQTWHNIQIIFTTKDNLAELLVDGVSICNFAARYLPVSVGVRLFDSAFSYDCYVKGLTITTSNEERYSGQRTEESADFISYQTTKPDANGKFDLRVIAGLDSIFYRDFGYEVLVLTENDSGKLTELKLTGSDTKVYSSIYAGNTAYSIKNNFGYQYASLATIKGLDSNLDRLELVIFPYTTNGQNNRVYGKAIALVYTGETKDGYPIFSEQSTTPINVTPSDDTYIYVQNPTTSYATSTELTIRNPGKESSNLYRAAYFKFTIPAEDAKKLETASRANFTVYISGLGDADRALLPLDLYATDTNWTETTLTASTKDSKAALGEEPLDTVESYNKGDYISFDILEHLKTATGNPDGSLTVSFCIRQPDGNTNAREVRCYTKEQGNRYTPTIRIETSYYGRELANTKTFNAGADPIGYAKKLADNWFGDLIDQVYPKDKNGNVIYYEIDALAPNGYKATTTTGDFTNEMTWKDGSPWSTNASNGYMVTSDTWKAAKFARTLSTLGTSTKNQFLSSAYAKTQSEYDIYGGITNAGFKGTKTGFFHTEKHGDRTYIIDPQGYPYFAIGMNTVTLGDSDNHKSYSLAAYGTAENYYNEISASLKDMGINTFYGGDFDELLDVENGLSGVVSINVAGTYMRTIGRSKLSESIFPYNNTFNIFDPDFETTSKAYVASVIKEGGYKNMSNLFGYTTDNELPSGTDILDRYLTLDPSVPGSAFSYHAAWEWLAGRLGTANPTLDDYLTHKDRAKINGEFLGYVYANYYRVARDAIKAADPNHMYLGSRVNGNCRTEEGYLRSAGYYLDIITTNLYGGLNPDAETITNLYRCSGKPFIVTEFFAKGTDTLDANGYRLTNSTGAGILVNEQQDRADYFEHYSLILLESKACVGWTWYRYRDNDQSLWSAGGLENLRMLHMVYGENAHPNTLMDADGNIYTTGELGKWDADFTKTYTGEGLASNQNVNKGIYNSNFSSTVVVYTYDKNGKLITSEPCEVKDPASESATKLTSKDGKTTFTVGTVSNAGGSTKTVLTTYKGKYVALANAIKNVSDNLIGLVNYFDAN